jgi:hypothetical protein
MVDFKPYVDRLFREAPDRRDEIRQNPVTGGHWMNGLDPVRPQKDAACRVLVARAEFAYWNPGLPPFPLSVLERAELKRRMGVDYLVAQYAVSLEGQRYDTVRHPSFEQYARGVMACPLAPDFITKDPQLLKRFPPSPLQGLGPGLVWNPPKLSS